MGELCCTTDYGCCSVLADKEKCKTLVALCLAVIGPIYIIFVFLQPVVIDPLYNDFYPLKNKELEAKILEMAEKAEYSR